MFGGVYKLVAVKLSDGTYQPKMKCSDSASKAIIPGKKMPWRLYDENGQAQCDLIAMDGEVIEAGKPVKMVNLDPDAIERTITITPTKVKQLLVPHILNGELAIFIVEPPGHLLTRDDGLAGRIRALHLGLIGAIRQLNRHQFLHAAEHRVRPSAI